MMTEYRETLLLVFVGVQGCLGFLSDSMPHLEVLNGSIEVISEVPFGGPRRGIVFLAHGCHHSATDFWPHSQHCIKCLGLAEQRRMVTELLSEGYGVVAVSSANRRRMCWSPTADRKRVLEALQILRRREGWESLPLFAIGSSSGGRLIGSLVSEQSLKFDAVAIQGMAIALRSGVDSFPPALFVTMAKDRRTTRLVRALVTRLREHERPALLLAVGPVPIQPSFFSDRIEEVDEELSSRLHKALLEKKLIDGKGWLRHNPRDSQRCPWREAFSLIPELKKHGLSLTADRSSISEELNVAWASHELTADFTKEILDWFACRGDLSKLKEQEDGSKRPNIRSSPASATTIHTEATTMVLVGTHSPMMHFTAA
ncbi:unnamed protein product [Vitrella brassicaformis CCMP3155]|uniref:Uncharacterized protein n=2 Tax=Vitrella brassicaformis TaxID=1169539 RepID=A0A0G4F678_VITBC|nr:unnamed protein product [Vitrella brassicaformis CCMP3155]|mmetsp:Transcript_2725/g.6195  ORF Transcript_2725/g.6195 Transcript_2725/m.6195 type:complete len:371 (+) Transcript_2725:211-1323(+)|eukprot:CEM07910.1 unnamed protein product [Vitrella brassicaformis CCMP3155]